MSGGLLIVGQTHVAGSVAKLTVRRSARTVHRVRVPPVEEPPFEGAIYLSGVS